MTIADQIARRLIVRRVVPSELERGGKIEMLAGGSLDSEIEKVILGGRSVTMHDNDESILSRCNLWTLFSPLKHASRYVYFCTLKLGANFGSNSRKPLSICSKSKKTTLPLTTEDRGFFLLSWLIGVIFNSISCANRFTDFKLSLRRATPFLAYKSAFGMLSWSLSWFRSTFSPL